VLKHRWAPHRLEVGLVTEDEGPIHNEEQGLHHVVAELRGNIAGNGCHEDRTQRQRSEKCRQ